MNTELILMAICGILLVVLYLRELQHAKERQEAEIELRRKVLNELKKKLSETDAEYSSRVASLVQSANGYSDVLVKYGIGTTFNTGFVHLPRTDDNSKT
jgi:hypothetical protein